MRAALITAGGRRAEAAAYDWTVTMTSGVPCDGFSLKLPAVKGITDVCRVELRDDSGALILTGIVDRTRVSPAEGIARVDGRGMAALLLDTEAVPVRYDRVSWTALEKRLLAPLGLRARGGEGLPEKLDFTIEAGISHFTAVTRFLEGRADRYPRFTPSGELNLSAAAPPKNPVRLDLPVTETLRRGGRTGTALIRDRDSAKTLTLENPERAALSLHGRAVFTAAGVKGFSDMQSSARRLMARGDDGAHTLEFTLPGQSSLRPCDYVMVENGLWMVGKCTLHGSGKTELELVKRKEAF